MSFSRVYSAQIESLKGEIVTIETDLARGLHAFSIVGLPDKAVEEARDRVSAAIKNSGFESPKRSNQKIVVSLSPADIKKEGALFDVAIALGYLLAEGLIAFDPEGKIFVGELALDGAVRPIKGVLALALAARARGFLELYVPEENMREAALVTGILVYPIMSLSALVSHLNTKVTKDSDEKILTEKIEPAAATEILYEDTEAGIDFHDIRGQESAKRGLLVAAAGGHNIAMYGPPGTGKTMLARAFQGILPPLSTDEVIEVTTIHSITGTSRGALVTSSPFRAPHHTSSYVSVIGGGATIRPGEVTLAHKGVLFLDEFPEFDKRVIESLRQPLEDGIVSIARARGTALFPSNFMLVIAMNPCPCGNYGSEGKVCRCMPADIVRYKRKLSGPIMDRIDIWLSVGPIDVATLGTRNEADQKESSGSVFAKEKVIAARARARTRFGENKDLKTNADMRAKDIEKYITLSEKNRILIEEGAKRLGLSARGYHRVLKLARTIADLDESNEIKDTHLLEALQYRPKIEN